MPLLDFCDHFQEDLVAATRLPLGVSEVGWLVYQQRGLCACMSKRVGLGLAMCDCEVTEIEVQNWRN